jgi:hypothetical protein
VTIAPAVVPAVPFFPIAAAADLVAAARIIVAVTGVGIGAEHTETDDASGDAGSDPMATPSFGYVRRGRDDAGSESERGHGTEKFLHR